MLYNKYKSIKYCIYKINKEMKKIIKKKSRKNTSLNWFNGIIICNYFLIISA